MKNNNNFKCFVDGKNVNFEYKTEDEIKTDNPELTDVIKSAVVDKTGTQTGLIAQEAEAVLASTVVTNSTGIKTLHTLSR